MLRSLTAQVERWPLATPFRISRGVRTVAEVVSVRLDQEGRSGMGESAPYARYGETPQSVLEQIEGARAALAQGATRADMGSLLPPGAARNAIDCALWDLDAKLSGRGVSTVLGRALEPLTTALTVSLDTPEKMEESAKELAGASLVKVKVNAEEPEACLRAVRRSVPAARMIVDPNESWDLPLLERLQPVLQELRADFVEQPLPAEKDIALEGFEPLVPICADESCHTAADLDLLARRYGMVNIKLDKTGGLTEALVLLEEARARGFGVMVGCMISTSLSIAPAMHVASLADYADLDGPLWLLNDRPGGVQLQDGQLTPPTAGFWG